MFYILNMSTGCQYGCGGYATREEADEAAAEALAYNPGTGWYPNNYRVLTEAEMEAIEAEGEAGV